MTHFEDKNLNQDTFQLLDRSLPSGVDWGQMTHPGLQNNWWRCVRRGPVSGRYEGENLFPQAGTRILDLRIDIDPRYRNSPVLDRISGDVYLSNNWGGHLFRWRSYLESWIVDAPRVKWERCLVTITGSVRYWEGKQPDTTIEIQIPWQSLTPAGPASVQFFRENRLIAEYRCTRRSNSFREISLEVDVCDSVNAEPILPAYQTDAHENRPPNMVARTLTIEESYREAGVEVSINRNRTVIDDSDPQFKTWSAAELHDAMLQNFSRIKQSWPNWHLWCLLASAYDDPDTVGIMFDAKAMYEGAGIAPDRQGCAVFRNHSVFNDLVPTPGNQDEAAAMRDLLYTYVHEIGHAFNFLHSWDKNRIDALSWMNYPDLYDWPWGMQFDTFWSDFEFRFDQEELIHLRHGNRDAVIMGGDSWASGSHFERPHRVAEIVDGEAPLELLLRSAGYFDFMQPVKIEFRLRNKSQLPIALDNHLNPEHGRVSILIQRPDGRTMHYEPALTQCAKPKAKTLEPLRADGSNQGEDRHSENVYLSFGAAGFYFDEPGEYQVQAVYHGNGEMMIPSNRCHVRIGRPFTREEDRFAQDYFSYDTGLCIYVGGSDSPFLAKGMACLQEAVDRFPTSRFGAQTALTLAHNLQRPFFRLNAKNQKLDLYRGANPLDVLQLTGKILNSQKQDDATLTNLEYHQTRRLRADAMVATGDVKEAKNELKNMVRYLKKHRVNTPVLDEIRQYAANL